MELFNATGETLSQNYDNVGYVFPPGEIVLVTDPCGAHILLKLSGRGLQKIRFGDDPAELGRLAVAAIVKYHEHQIEMHEIQVRVAGESKNPIPAEPEGYKLAKRRLPAYHKVLKKRNEDAEALAAKAEEAKITAGLGTEPGEIRKPAAMNVDELRDVIRSLGEEPNMRHGHKKLIETIEELREQDSGGD